MGKRGPSPLPPSIAVLHGERAAAGRAGAPAPRARLPRAPEDLSAEARPIWNHVVREMRSTGALRSADRDVLRLYCDAVVRYIRAQQLLADSGPLINGSQGRGLVRNPLHWIVRDNSDMVARLARELLLTPLARMGMPAVEEERDAADPFEAWRRGTGA